MLVRQLSIDEVTLNSSPNARAKALLARFNFCVNFATQTLDVQLYEFPVHARGFGGDGCHVG